MGTYIFILIYVPICNHISKFIISNINFKIRLYIKNFYYFSYLLGLYAYTKKLKKDHLKKYHLSIYNNNQICLSKKVRYVK